MDYYFKSKVALVVGASSGIGKAIAEAFAREGAITILSARSRERLEAIAKELCSKGFIAEAIVADVSIRKHAEELIDKVVNKFGRIDILVNSVGTHDSKRIFDSDPSEIERVLITNFMGPVYCTLRALRFMLESGSGVIVNISSIEGRRALRHPPGYVASKFALSGFTDLLRLELSGTGIHVLGVYPGYVETPLIEGLKLPSRKATKPIKPEEVANAVIKGIKRRKHEIVIPNPISTRIFLAINMLFPRLVDKLVDKLGLSGEIPR